MAASDFDFGMFDPLPASASEASLMDQPGVRSGLLSFGLQALQPVSAGQTPAGHIAQSIGQGAAGFSSANQLNRTQAREDNKDSREQQKVDLAERKLSLSERIAAQRLARGGATPLGAAIATNTPSSDSPAAEPPGTAQVPIGGTDPGTSEMGTPMVPRAKPPVSDFVSRYPNDWATIKQRAQNGSPAERASAAQSIAKLKTLVSDPQTIDTLLGS